MNAALPTLVVGLCSTVAVGQYGSPLVRAAANNTDQTTTTQSNTPSQTSPTVPLVRLTCLLAVLNGVSIDQECPPGSLFFPPLYNATDIRTPPLTLQDGTTVRYKFAVISDLDKGSKSETEKNTWNSLMRNGHLDLNLKSKAPMATIGWDGETVTLKSRLSEGGRGMEMSDLKIFDAHLLTVDDRTGVVYRIINNKSVPWVLLSDGPGDLESGLKGEWMTVKGSQLYVGSTGKEWTSADDGSVENTNAMWIKIVSHTGFVRHVDWVDNYKKLRKAIGIEFPGYMVHESGQWSATNYLLIADETFDHVEARLLGPFSKIRGFSAFQFVPGTSDSVIVALKSEEVDGTENTYITVLNINSGAVLFPETQLDGHYKFEGIEFI